MYLVYKHITPNGKIYVGQTKQSVKNRWRGGKGYKGNLHFSRAISIYGWDNIQHIIVSTDLTKKEADYLERYLIRYYESDNPKYGYNLTEGGEGVSWTSERKKALSDKTSGTRKEQLDSIRYLSNETRRKKVICVETNTQFSSISNAAKASDLSHSAIIKAIKNNSTAAGYHWKYAS